jgi:membrane fusion protein (multidrug efflux system)
MAKYMLRMLIIMGLLLGGVFGFKIFQALMMKKFMSARSASVASVSATPATYQTWQPKLRTTGSVRAIQGVDVTTEVAGLVKKIHFAPGSQAKAGDVLIELNADSDRAQFDALRAAAELAAITYKRDKAQYAIRAISKATLDAAAADLKSKQAQADAQAAIFAKKTIRAPFTGRLGISSVNPGQYLNPGNKIVTLQSLDPIYVDFYIPQQALASLEVGQAITLTTDAYPHQAFMGKITAIDPKVDIATRNVQVEATLSNAELKLVPGMYGAVEIYTGAAQKHLTLPKTAISFNPYGEIVYLVKESGKDKEGKPLLTVKQSFVTVGESRGDQIAVLKGINEGDLVVIAGQLKLKNDSVVTINNAVMPTNDPAPHPVDQ